MVYKKAEQRCDICVRVLPPDAHYHVRVYDELGVRVMAVSMCPSCAERIPGANRIKDLMDKQNKVSRDDRIAQQRERILEGV